MNVGKIAGEVLHGIEYPFTETHKIVKVIDTVMSEQTEAKAVFTALFAKCNSIGADTLISVGAKGLNIVEDLKVAKEVEDLGGYLKSTVFPLIEKLYGEIQTDVKG